MAALGNEETVAAFFSRLYSFYRYSFPSTQAAHIPLFVVGGFEKRFGSGVLGCAFCGYTADCRIHPDVVTRAHYTQSPTCYRHRLDDSPFDALLLRLQLELRAGASTCQYLFEDDYLRLCCSDPDFRQVSFALGQWAANARLPAAQLAANGFYFAAKKPIARCLACLLPVETNSLPANLPEWHQRTSPACRIVQKIASGGQEFFRYTHDPSGHVQQLDPDIEIVVRPQSVATSQNNSASRSANSSYHAAAAAPVSNPPPATTGSLAQLFRALNAVGLTDEALRKAIAKEPALLNSTSSAAFLQLMQEKTERPSHTAVETETTLRAGNMTTVTDAKCFFCVNDWKNTAFVPCGHVFGCLACCIRVKNGATALDRRCCACRRPVEDVMPLHLTWELTEH